MNVYEKLRERLDNLGPGFPVSSSGVEMKILKKLFTEEEAEFFLNLAPLLEDPKDTARRLGRDPVQTAELMERMAQKGLLFRNRKGESVRYAAVPYVVGIFEFQLNRMDKEFARDMEEYMQESFDLTVESHKTPILRTIPIQKDLVAEWPVAPYEDAMAIIDRKETIAVCPCICRKMSTWMNGHVTNPWKPASVSDPMPTIMWKTIWGAISTGRRPRKSCGVTRSRAGDSAFQFPDGGGNVQLLRRLLRHPSVFEETARAGGVGPEQLFCRSQ